MGIQSSTCFKYLNTGSFIVALVREREVGADSENEKWTLRTFKALNHQVFGASGSVWALPGILVSVPLRALTARQTPVCSPGRLQHSSVDGFSTVFGKFAATCGIETPKHPAILKTLLIVKITTVILVCYCNSNSRPPYIRRLKFIQYRTGVWKCHRSLLSRPQPQYWIKFLDPWVHDFYPVLGWGLATSQGEHNSPQHLHWIKIGLPYILIRKLFSSGRSGSKSARIVNNTGSRTLRFLAP